MMDVQRDLASAFADVAAFGTGFSDSDQSDLADTAAVAILSSPDARAATSGPAADGQRFDEPTLSPDLVRQRFRWAARQGYPAWLWPEVPVARWHAALVAIEEALRDVLDGRIASHPLDGDPEAMSVACYTSGVGPLLGHWAQLGLVTATPRVAAMLSRHLRHNKARTALLTAETVKLARALAGHQGLSVVILKGMHSAHAYFPAPGTRPMSDIDLLVRAADAAVIDKMLERRGFEPRPATPGPPAQREWCRPDVAREPKTLSYVHAEDPWSLDVQSSLDRRYATGARTIRLDAAATGDMLAPWQLCPEARVLRQPLLLLHLALHASCGFQSLTLLRLTELVMVARADSASGALSWPAFIDMADQLGALGLVYPALHLSEKLAPGTIPSAVITAARDRTPQAVSRFVEQLRPASAQRVVRYSLAEKFMWTTSRRALVRQVVSDIVPPGANSASALAARYGARAWKLVRRTVTR